MSRMHPHLESLLTNVLVPLLSVLAAALAGTAIFSVMGYDGPGVAREVFVSPLVNPHKWPDLALRSGPLVLIAAGLAISFRAGVWNIGAEGQYILGAIGATAAAMATGNLSAPWAVLTMLLAGIALGAAWAAIPAFLRTRLHVNEVLSTLMLTYVAVQLLNYLVAGHWRSPTNLGLPATSYFNPSHSIPPISAGGLVHWGVPLAVLIAVVVWIVIRYSLAGFFVKVTGLAPKAAAYSGIPSKIVVFCALTASGALAGLAGAIEVSGTVGKLSLSFPSGYGYAGIVVVFLARLNPLTTIFAGLMIAVISVGGDLAQIATGVPHAAAGVFEVLALIFLLAGDALARMLQRLTRLAAMNRTEAAA